MDARGWVGPCRVQTNRGLFPPSAPICNVFIAKGGVVLVAKPRPASSERSGRSVAPVIVRQRPERSALPVRSSANANIDFEGADEMTREQWIDLFREAMGEPEPPALAPKWEGGTVKLVPAKDGVQGRELPIDSLFHKIVMIRDRLRTLEQKINAHPKLTDGEKVDMQHYITRNYGSLTSFNLLFRDKEDQFAGAKGEE